MTTDDRAGPWWDHVKDQPFLCDTCHGFHPLREHRDCRAKATAAAVERAREAITKEDHR